MARDGRHVLVVGRPGHVEVQGIIEDLESYDVLPDAECVRAYPSRRLGIVCQTTMSDEEVRAVWARIQLLNPLAHIDFADTVCDPTKRRIEAVRRLADRVDAVVVVGGANSNNTRRLVALCKAQGVPAYHVQEATDLQSAWFDGCDAVGLTAGTSTTDAKIDEVFEALASMGAITV